MPQQKVLVEVDKIHSFYDKYIKQHGFSAGWSTKQSAESSYQSASSCSHQRWSDFETVLDVGSGEGHFFDFLRSQCGFKGQYTGLELLPFFYQNSLELYGDKENAEFIFSEFLKYDFGERKFDWVISLGSLAVKQKQQQEYDLAVCRKMIDLAKYGVTVYLNDINQMKPGRLEEVPELAAHDIDRFTAMLQKECDFSSMEIVHYPTPDSQKTMIHLIL